jgi:hypothetical protein
MLDIFLFGAVSRWDGGLMVLRLCEFAGTATPFARVSRGH